MELPRITVAVSVDGLAPDHDVRRRPATYDRILQNIVGRRVNIHCTIVRQHMQQPDYLEQFLAFWSARPEVNRIWFSVYTPQRNESTPEMLLPDDRLRLARQLPAISRRFPKLMLPDGMARGFCGAAPEPGGVPLLEDVRQLHGRPENQRRALCFRRRSRLQPVRMLH